MTPVNFQGTSRRQGDDFEQRCNKVLEYCAYPLGGKLNLKVLGVEIDQTTVRNGRVIWIEYKGSVTGKRPGLIRTDSMKKAIANGALTKEIRTRNNVAFWVVTSHMPVEGASIAMAQEALRLGYVDQFLTPTQLCSAS